MRIIASYRGGDSPGACLVTLGAVPARPPHDDSAASSGPDAYAEVLDRIRSGDPEAIDDLLLRAQGIARRYSLAICGSAPDRDDAMQEALLKTFRHAGQIREPRAFRAWLYRTVKNACLVGRRRKAFEAVARPDGEETEDVPDHATPADFALEAAETRRQIRSALARLRPAYREAVFLRDLEGLSTREVAAVLGITEANVKVRLHRAHAELRAVLR
jgi:RNA polymerase sigma-70 factor, ECF subfamily